MIADLKPYPEYKESGSRWLGLVPGHWRVVRNGSLFGQRNQTGYAELPILEVSLKTGVRVRDFEKAARKQVMSDFGKYKRAAKGDVAYNMMRMWQGAVGVSPVDGLVSPAYVVARPYPEVEPQFFVDLFRTGVYMSEVDNCSHGIVKDRNRLYWDQFKQMLSPCPPSDEQAAIVRFLDWANGRLERAIRAKRKVIALLMEQKQAIIHRAVTRGLDPTVPLKPSGIPWLGDIPRHWEVRRLKFVTSEIVDCLHATPRYSESGSYPAIRTADISPGIVHVEKAKKISEKDFSKWTERLAPAEGDILYSREGERYGIAACVPKDVRLCISQRMMVFRISRAHCSEFVMRLLNSQPIYGQALQDATGATAPHVNISTIRNYYLALPDKSEQEEISRNLSLEEGPINTAISRLEREIELLREYRTRLVADVVTGKLDVREAAAKLPDEIDDLECGDETAAMKDESETVEAENNE